jgi:hypothetical protein
MIGDQMVMVMMTHDDKAKIGEDEKPGKKEPRAPEWIRDPIIQVVVVPGRGIVGDDWWALLIVIVVYYRGVRLGLVFSILARTTWDNS